MGNRSVILIQAVLHRSLKQALKLGLIGRNPVEAVTRPKMSHKEMHTLSGDQARLFILGAKATRCEALFYLALHTGMRQSELLGLKWSDLDWSARTLQVQRQVQRIPQHELTFVEPKSAAGRRSIVLGATAIEKLQGQLDRIELYRLDAGTRWHENNLMFPTRLRTPMHPTSMYKDFKALLKKLDLPDIRFHDLRHTCATLLIQQGVHPKVVQERLGHADITLTLNTYSHTLPAMQEEAADELDQLLTPINVSQEIKKIEEVQAVYDSQPREK